MSRYDLSRELGRTVSRPIEPPASLLALFSVQPAMGQNEYVLRLRDLISKVLNICPNVDFEQQEEIDARSLPQWFLSATNGERNSCDDVSPESIGKKRYLENRGGFPWSIEEWIYCFDPELRSWSWWDMTDGTDGKVWVWVDTKGEGHVPCEEFWWALYVAGADTVEPLTLEYSDKWQAQTSLGLSPDPPA